MTTSGQTVSDVLADRIEALRDRRGLSTRGLAKRCADLGAPALTHEVLYNIKTGRRDATGRRRRDVTVDEFMALAAALDVAPAWLLTPPADDAPTPVTPGRAEPAATVRAWVGGQAPLPGTDEVEFWAQAPRQDAVTVAELRRDVAELKRRYTDLAGAGRPSAAKRARLEAAMAEQENEDG